METAWQKWIHLHFLRGGEVPGSLVEQAVRMATSDAESINKKGGHLFLGALAGLEVLPVLLLFPGKCIHVLEPLLVLEALLQLLLPIPCLLIIRGLDLQPLRFGHIYHEEIGQTHALSNSLRGRSLAHH